MTNVAKRPVQSENEQMLVLENLVAKNQSLLQKTQSDMLEVIDDYFSLNEASTPIKLISEINNFFFENTELGDYDKVWLSNIQFNISELFVLLTKTQNLFTKIDGFKHVLEIANLRKEATNG